MLIGAMAIAGCSKRDGLTTPTQNTPVVNLSRTITITSTPVIANPNTATITRTATQTRTILNTATATGTSTQIEINSPTITATITATETGADTLTATSTPTATSTSTATQTLTPIITATAIATVIGGIAQPTVVLGTSARFAVLSFSDLTDIPACAITGDVGISPGLRSNITGLLNGDGQVNSSYAIYAADDADPVPAMLTQAYNDAGAAYLDAVASTRGTPTSISGNINGLTLAPGLYESGTSIEISPGGIVYLDGLGDINAVFIIRSATSITTESTSEVVLSGGTQAKNVFWVAGSTITLGANSIMKGTLIASTSISMLNMANLSGRALIQSASAGQISLSQNIIVLP